MRSVQKRAEKISIRGEHKHHKLGAVVAIGNSILSVGWNKDKTHPKSPHAWKHVHAEMDAIIKAGKNCEGADLYVARIGRDGTLRNAKPCPACMSLILASGLHKVHFTDNGGWSTITIE